MPRAPTTAVTRRIAVAAAIALCALCLVDVVRGARSTARTVGEHRVDFLPDYLDRFAPLGPRLQGVPVAGYVHRAEPAEHWPRGNPHAFLSQYALAPTVLDESGRHELVVGNFHSDQARQSFLADTGMVVREDLGRGIVLLDPPPAP